jgi:hypothetical protein
MKTPNRFYVYAYLRSDNYTPFYIGKGSGKRCYDGHGKNCTPPKDTSKIIIIKDNLSEDDAFELEKVLIKFWGRKCDGGILLNICPGGIAPPIGDGSNLLPYNEKRKITGSKIHPAKEVTINGITYHSIKYASEILNINHSTLSQRARLGNDLDKPVKTPNKILVLIGGEEFTVNEAAKIMNISTYALRNRIRRNHPSVEYVII